MIDAFFDYLWQLPLAWGEKWDEWEKSLPALVGTALGDEWPAGFEDFLDANGLRHDEFRRLLSSVAEIVFSSFYGAADDLHSLEFLSEVLKITNRYGISPPPVEAFRASRFADGHGWGNPMTASERDAWRALEY